MQGRIKVASFPKRSSVFDGLLLAWAMGLCECCECPSVSVSVSE